MRVFVLWRPKPGSKERPPSEVARALLERFGPLFQPTPQAFVRPGGPAHLAWIELPVSGFLPAFFQEEDERWAFAPEYPLNARRLLRERGRTVLNGSPVLPALGSELAARPAEVLRELIPPACLIWNQGEEIRVQNDGLGQAQLFEYEDERVWALSNRVTALPVLGVPLAPVPEEWAVRFTTGWFPLWTSGFRNVRFLQGGTQIHVGPGGIRRERHDPVAGWIHPPAASREDCLELGRLGMERHLADGMELWTRPTLGLSGGWDSRAVAACLRSLGADFEARVRGAETNYDVLISSHLARISGLPHRVKGAGGVPPDTTEGCRRSISRALLWQGGNFATLKHKSFLARSDRPHLDGGVVNVMGQHAGVGKGDFAVRVRAHEHPPERYEDLLVASLLGGTPPILRDATLPAVEELIRSSYRRAADYGLWSRGPLHFFFLHEYTRRWGSATVAGQSGVVVTPFLNPDVIRACYGLPEDELPTKPLHRHVTATYAPEWADVPYADQLTDEDLASGRIPLPEPKAEPSAEDAEDLPRWRRTERFRNFNYKFYWRDVGRPLFKEALSQGGFWTELFDPDRVQEHRKRKGTADHVVIAHLLPGVLDESAAC